MSWGRVGLLYLVAGVLAAIYVHDQRLPPPGTAPAEHPALLGVAAEAIRSLRLSRGTRVVVIERGGDGWVVREPADAAIAPGLIDAFVEALAGARPITAAGDATADPTPFGLGEQADRIEVRSDVAAPVVVLIGSTNPTGTSVYAQRIGDPQVEVVGRNLAYYADLLFQALPPAQVPPEIHGPVGG